MDINKNTTLYACWSANKYQVNFEADGITPSAYFASGASAGVDYTVTLTPSDGKFFASIAGSEDGVAFVYIGKLVTDQMEIRPMSLR